MFDQLLAPSAPLLTVSRESVCVTLHIASSCLFFRSLSPSFPGCQGCFSRYYMCTRCLQSQLCWQAVSVADTQARRKLSYTHAHKQCHRMECLLKPGE